MEWLRLQIGHGPEIFRRSFPSNRSIEHLAQRQPIHNAAFNAKTHNPTRGEKLGGGTGVTPKTALSVGLKVDLDALPSSLVDQLKAG